MVEKERGREGERGGDREGRRERGEGGGREGENEGEIERPKNRQSTNWTDHRVTVPVSRLLSLSTGCTSVSHHLSGHAVLSGMCAVSPGTPCRCPDDAGTGSI